MKLQEMGFVDPLENLDALRGEMFAIIADEISKLQNEKSNRAKKR
jgi:hypothetical protein